MDAPEAFRQSLSIARAKIEAAKHEPNDIEARNLAAEGYLYLNTALQVFQPIEFQSRCQSETCNRIIRDHDPLFGGFCSTICREASLLRQRGFTLPKGATA